MNKTIEDAKVEISETFINSAGEGECKVTVSVDGSEFHFVARGVEDFGTVINHPVRGGTATDVSEWGAREKARIGASENDSFGWSTINRENKYEWFAVTELEYRAAEIARKATCHFFN